MMKNITLILNWLVVVLIVTFSVIMFVAPLPTNPEGLAEIGLVDGADGPTTIFISTKIHPVEILIPLLFIVVMLMNIFVIRKQEKQIMNQRLPVIDERP